jgi:hypothetical protein
MAVVGGTTSVITGGKFANGAESGAFVHLYNAEWRVSVSLSGGAGVGGTLEVGASIAYDSTLPWYTGWSITAFGTVGGGGYFGADVGGEINVGWSDNNDVSDIGGKGTVVGGSADILGFLNYGYETTLSQTGARPLHNYSFGIYGNPFVPGEFHEYWSITDADTFRMSW